MIVALVAAVAIVLYLLLKRNTIPAPTPLVSVPIPSAPGVAANTGYVPPVTPPPPPPGVSAVTRAKAFLAPSQAIQNVPIVGGIFGSVNKVVSLPTVGAFKVTDTINNSLGHIPVVGSVIAAPGKALTSAAKSLTSWL